MARNGNGQDAWNETTAQILTMAAKELRALERRLLAEDRKDPLAERASRLAKRLDKRRRRIEKQTKGGANRRAGETVTIGGSDAAR